MSHFEMAIFLDRVDSIQRKFLESLITGQRGPLFARSQPQSKPEPYAQSQSGSKS
jgi:hypothetical protein